MSHLYYQPLYAITIKHSQTQMEETIDRFFFKENKKKSRKFQPGMINIGTETGRPPLSSVNVFVLLKSNVHKISLDSDDVAT